MAKSKREKKASSLAADNLLIKGYLPVRLKFPPSFAPLQDNEQSKVENVDDEEGESIRRAKFVESNSSFLYVKEHQSGNSKNKNNNDNNESAQERKDRKRKATLFIANAPVIAGVSTSLLLQSIFGRYGNVARVTVIANPRKQQQQQQQQSSQSAAGIIPNHLHGKNDQESNWTSEFPPPSFLPLPHLYNNTTSTITTGQQRQGKFAHVVMETSKDLKQTLQHLARIMNEEDDDIDINDYPPGLTLDAIELQTLADETERQEEDMQRNLGRSGDDEEEDDDVVGGGEKQKDGGLGRIIRRYQKSKRCFLHHHGRQTLLAECNRVMEQWEEADADRRLAIHQAANQPDEDGFITVSYGSSTAAAPALPSTTAPDDEGDAVRPPTTSSTTMKRRARQRNRKKNSNKTSSNKVSGATPLSDFYRFQTKDNRKRTLHELRERFEEDLAKVKKMKEEKQYRPF